MSLSTVQPRSMKAAVMHQTGAPLTLEDVPIPCAGPGEVLVETRTSGICGTDLHILDGHGYVPRLPHILGHEPSGVVLETGPGVSSVKPGDRVVPHLFFSCGACFYCRSGREQQCAGLKGILGVLCNGAFSEVFRAPVENIFVLPGSVPFDIGGLIADAVLTGLHAFKRSGLKAGQSAAVIGTGGVGQIIVQVLAYNGVRAVAVDHREDRLELARNMGAEAALLVRNGAAAQIRDFSAGRGVDCVFDVVGSSASLRFAADVCMNCGRIVVIGEEPEFPPIDTTEIAQRELEIVGSRNGTRADMAEAIALVAAGAVKPHVAAHFPLEEINSAFEAVRQGANGRVVVVVKQG